MPAADVHWPLLDALSPEARERFLASARRRPFRRGDVVFGEGDQSDSMHLVVSGVFAVEVRAPDGDRAMLNVLAPGDFFGELSLVAAVGPAHRTATVSALAVGQTLVVSEQAFREVREAHPEVERLLVAALATRVDQLSGRLLEALHTAVDRRVYRRLLELAEIFDDGVADVIIPLAQDDIATMAGASRPTVNQVLQRQVTADVIELGRRRITITDRDGLQAAADDS
jgi:CRP-like cAMP-binding protein